MQCAAVKNNRSEMRVAPQRCFQPPSSNNPTLAIHGQWPTGLFSTSFPGPANKSTSGICSFFPHTAAERNTNIFMLGHYVFSWKSSSCNAASWNGNWGNLVNPMFFPQKTIFHQSSAKMQFPQTEIPSMPFPPIYFPWTEFPLKIVGPMFGLSWSRYSRFQLLDHRVIRQT